jgi:hypothetical protein
MVTGRKAFQATSPVTQAWLERVVGRCLAKDSEDRWQSMRDVVLELRSPVAEVAGGYGGRRSLYSASGSNRATVASLGRTQIPLLSGAVANKANDRPSGEEAKPRSKSNWPPSGGLI